MRSHSLKSLGRDVSVGSVAQWTNVSKDFKGTLDYIFYTHESLVPAALLELPEDSTVQKSKNSGLPNEHWSSDHIALMAEFAYRQQRGHNCLPGAASRRKAGHRHAAGGTT